MLDSHVSRLLSPQGIAITLSVLATTFILNTLIVWTYNIFFHPLKHIPGSKWAVASRIPYVRHLLKGTMADDIRELHEKYGEVVRVAPNEVSFISGESAWQDIYGFHHGQGPVQFEKDRTWFIPAHNGIRNINATDAETHSRMRRAMAHAFSDKSIKEQEPLIDEYIEKLISGLSDHIKSSPDEPVNLVLWLNWTTFDIIGDLTYGESFGCLDNQREHDFVKMVFASIKAGSQLISLSFMPQLKHLLPLFISSDVKNVTATRGKFFNLGRQRVTNRLAQDTDRPDFMTQIAKDRGDKGLSRDEMDANSVFLMAAGSETTATMTSGTLFALLKHPRALKKLQDEIRGSFQNVDEIDLLSLQKLPYLAAVIEEGLRYYPPVPWGLPRAVPKGGATISGRFIPEGTSVYMSQYAAYHSERNFSEPEVFAPERWLDDPRYAEDKKTVLKPFSFGPRNCLGMNLAYAEMRLILSRIIYEFDMQLVDPNTNWLKQKSYILWEKEPLKVKFSKAVRT